MSLFLNFVGRIQPPGRKIKDSVKALHWRASRMFHRGTCFCCGRRKLEHGDAEFDHFNRNPNCTASHEIWLICGGCHRDFSTGRLRREDRRTHFAYYQCLLSEASNEIPGLLKDRTP
jgi:hypothetical protein